MIFIPNILYSNPRDFCEVASSWAKENIHLLDKIKRIASKPESNIRYEVSVLDGDQVLRLIIACLGYTKIEPSELGLPSIRERLKLHIEECGRLLDIPSSAIRPIAAIELEILTLISEN